MEVRKDGTRILRSSLGPAKLYLMENGKTLRIELDGVVFLDDYDACDLQQAIAFWRNSGRLPGIEKVG